jgi:hypothetical protein
MQDDLKYDDDLKALAAESMGWQPLCEGAYLYLGGGQANGDELIIHVVGVPDIALVGQNVLLVTG